MTPTPAKAESSEVSAPSRLDTLAKVRKLSLEKKFAKGQRLGAIELAEIGVTAGTAQHPRYAQGLAGIAREIAAILKIQCSRQYIFDWRKRRPPFPPPGDHNLYDVELCLDWVRENIITAQNGHDEPGLFQRAAAEKAKGEIAEEEHRQWEREVERGGWMNRTEYKRALEGIGRILKVLIVRREEVIGPQSRAEKLRALGVAEVTVESFSAWDRDDGRNWIDAIGLEFRKRCEPE